MLAILHGIACNVDLKCKISESECMLQNINLNDKEIGKIDTRGESIKKIWISDSNMTDIPFDKLLNTTELKDVTNIAVQNSHVQKFHQDFTPNLNKITQLRITGNNITELKKRAFYRFPKLEILAWNENNLRHLEPGTFDNLNQVEELDFGYNMIQDLPDALFENLESLKFVNFENNQIQVLRENLFSSCTKIEELDLKNNKINSIAVNMFTKCMFPENATLDLSSNTCYDKKLVDVHKEKAALIDCLLESYLNYMKEETDKKIKGFHLELDNIEDKHQKIGNGTEIVENDFIMMASFLGGGALVLILLVLILVIYSHRKQTTQTTHDYRESITLEDCNDYDSSDGDSSSDSDGSYSESSSDNRRKPKAIMHHKK